MINCLHHFEILTHSSQRLLNYFINGYKFNLVATKQTGNFTQYLINSNSINFLIINLAKSDALSEPAQHDSNYTTPLSYINKYNSSLYDTILNKNDTVFNVAFQVRDLDRILSNCLKHKANILRDKHVLFDKAKSEHGYVECAVIESCVPGVTHSLFDMSKYTGKFLPGFESDNPLKMPQPINDLTHFDHLTYAIYKNSSHQIIDWYKKIFNMKRFKIEKKDDDGLIVKTGESGMNLKVINYWLCGETGLEYDCIEKTHVNNTVLDSSFKFVISEPLEDSSSDDQVGKKNQISIFLDDNNGPGIQHIGLFSNDIVKSVRDSKRNNVDMKYYATPEQYYKTVGFSFAIKF